MGYRKVGYLEQVLYVFKWMFQKKKKGKGE